MIQKMSCKHASIQWKRKLRSLKENRGETKRGGKKFVAKKEELRKLKELSKPSIFEQYVGGLKGDLQNALDRVNGKPVSSKKCNMGPQCQGRVKFDKLQEKTPLKETWKTFSAGDCPTLCLSYSMRLKEDGTKEDLHYGDRMKTLGEWKSLMVVKKGGPTVEQTLRGVKITQKEAGKLLKKFGFVENLGKFVSLEWNRITKNLRDTVGGVCKGITFRQTSKSKAKMKQGAKKLFTNTAKALAKKILFTLLEVAVLALCGFVPGVGPAMLALIVAKMTASYAVSQAILVFRNALQLAAFEEIYQNNKAFAINNPQWDVKSEMKDLTLANAAGWVWLVGKIGEFSGERSVPRSPKTGYRWMTKEESLAKQKRNNPTVKKSTFKKVIKAGKNGVLWYVEEKVVDIIVQILFGFVKFLAFGEFPTAPTFVVSSNTQEVYGGKVDVPSLNEWDAKFFGDILPGWKKIVETANGPKVV